jgi:hypothetical protein
MFPCPACVARELAFGESELPSGAVGAGRSTYCSTCCALHALGAVRLARLRILSSLTAETGSQAFACVEFPSRARLTLVTSVVHTNANPRNAITDEARLCLKPPSAAHFTRFRANIRKFSDFAVDTASRHLALVRVLPGCTFGTVSGTRRTVFPSPTSVAFIVHGMLFTEESSCAVFTHLRLVIRPFPRSTWHIGFDLVPILLVLSEAVTDRDGGQIHARHEVALA